MPPTSRRRALITGGSAGLGLALASGLAADDWDVVITGRGRARLRAAAAELGPRVTAVSGDVTDPGHREQLAEVVADGLDLLVNNASTLGVSPLVPVQELTGAVLRRVWETNVVAPVALIRTLRSLLRDGAAVIDITSDAAAEHYETWGAYSDRPLPETVVPAFLALVDQRPPSGRYRASELRALVEVPGLVRQMEQSA
jgi:NAD(P)-dependent dehydrogenase (short-subunit alcohol dehydrogenase family)